MYIVLCLFESRMRCRQACDGYGYLKGTTSADSEGIDVWIGSDPRRQVTGALCTVDLVKHDAELKILVGCTAGDCAVIRRFYRTPLSAVRILRRKKP